MTACGSVWPLWVHVNCTLTMSLDNVYSLVEDSTLLQQTTNIWKIPAQTDVTCSGVLLQLCSRPSILLISSTIWCRFWLISAPLLSESKRRKNRRENCSTAASQSGQVAYILILGSIERTKYVTKHLRVFFFFFFFFFFFCWAVVFFSSDGERMNVLSSRRECCDSH